MVMNRFSQIVSPDSRSKRSVKERAMGFQARLCFFFLLTFSITCLARKIPYGNERTLASEDFDDTQRVHRFPPPPGDDIDHMPRVLPFPPPPVTNVATLLSENEKPLFNVDYEGPHTHPPRPPHS
ncbi:hypothetical protein FH972_011715 [Carpinus fangiana]|uniref:Uncharacterized protein n=1 Tax=Carpinus fangiana TaxID=176857 RepID=A0A660KV78_9ROSI|nr:hypothetical protein FH972_011715 [Carpinus fangiana]KAE8039288.1 hypothetical protein FH972_011715 [Carpinus fangiana]